MNQDVFTLNEGNAVIQWPKAMSNESYTDFVDWLELIKRKAKRTIVKDTDDKEDWSSLAE